MPWDGHTTDAGEPVEYLGDGAYVKFTGYSYVLMANDHEHPTDEVHLEQGAMEALVRFQKIVEEK